MYLQFHSVKEPSKNRDIRVCVLFGSFRGSVRLGFLHIFNFIFGSCSVRFLVKPGFWFGSFLLGSGSSPSLGKISKFVSITDHEERKSYALNQVASLPTILSDL